MKINQKFLRVLTCVGLCTFSSLSMAHSSLARPLDDCFKPRCWRPVVTFTAAALFPSDVGRSQTIPIVDPVTDSFFIYNAQNQNQTMALLGGFVGAEFLLRPTWSIQAGLGYYQPTSNFSVKGIVTQGADLQSADSYAYNYQIQTHQLLVESKLLYNWRCYHPYFALGLGAAFNDVSNFNVNIVPPFTTFSNQFASQSNTSFSYAVGFGVDMNVRKKVRLGLGYRFRDLGRADTGRAVIDVVQTSNRLTQSHLYTNEVQAQLSWVG